MKTLYLIRHAKSSWEDDTLSDFHRPLNRRGKTDAPKMGRLFKEKGILPDTIISSPALRALTTAGILAGEMGFDTAAIVQEKRIYEAGVSTLMQIIREIDDGHDSAMLFGHNPGFTWLANDLGSEMIDNVPTLGAVTIHLAIDHWKETEASVGSLHAFDFPKKYFY